jgi:shikimate kinase
MTSTEPPRPRIGIVGVCASGKSTLANALRDRGFDARQVSQEHSYVRDLWRRFSHCDILIFLDVSLDTLRRRLADPTWPEFLYEDQRERVRSARDECDLYVATDDLSPAQTLACALALLAARGVAPWP